MSLEIKGEYGNKILLYIIYDHPHEETFTIEILIGELNYKTQGYCSYENLKDFYKDLKISLKDNKSKVNFFMTYNGVDLCFIPDGLGNYIIHGKILDTIPDKNNIQLDFKFESDQTYLNETLNQLEGLIKTLQPVS